MHPQNQPYQQNPNVHHMPPSPRYNNTQPMRSPQQVHSSGIGQTSAGAGRIPQQQQTSASFLAYSAGDVASMAPNRNNLNQAGSYTSSNIHSSSNPTPGVNTYSGYNSNMSLLTSSGGSNMSSSTSNPSRNVMNQQRYNGKYFTLILIFLTI